MALDRSSGVPLYQQLATQFRAAIEDGTLRPGDAFENELDLAARLHLSRPTIRRAIAELVRAGLLVRRRGIGTEVASGVIHERDHLTSLFTDLSSRGRQPRTTVLSFDRAIRNPIAAQALGLAPRTPLVRLERLRFVGPMPLVVLRSWLAPTYADLDPAAFTRQGLYDVLGGRGVHAVRARQRIGARTATGVERKLLHLTRADAVLTVLWQSYDERDEPIEFGDHAYRGDQYHLDSTLTLPPASPRE